MVVHARAPGSEIERSRDKPTRLKAIKGSVSMKQVSIVCIISTRIVVKYFPKFFKTFLRHFDIVDSQGTRFTTIIP